MMMSSMTSDERLQAARITRSAAYLACTHGCAVDLANVSEESVRIAESGQSPSSGMISSLLVALQAANDLPDIKSARRLLVKTLLGPDHITKGTILEITTKQIDKAEEAAAVDAAKHFARCVKSVNGKIAAMNAAAGPKEDAEKQAEGIMKTTFNEKKWLGDLQKTIGDRLIGAFVAGAAIETGLTKSAMQGKLTSAEVIASQLNITLPPGMTIGSLPDWLLKAARAAIADTFQQDYWLDVVKTTRADIKRDLIKGIEKGLGTREIAKLIEGSRGGEYDKFRGLRVARTEVPNMLNAGHSAGIEQLEDETGLEIGKEWVSVLGNTTRSSHAKIDGKRVATKEMFSLGGVKVPWPAHYSLPPEERINCFVGSTRLSGEIIACSRAPYEGLLREVITASGRRLAVTPNHPILSSHGFVRAGELEVGAKLLSAHTQVDGFSSDNRIVPGNHEYSEPVTCEDVFEALASWHSIGRSIEKRGCTVNDFYGDAKSFIGKVEIASSFSSDEHLRLKPREVLGSEHGNSDFISPAFAGVATASPSGILSWPDPSFSIGLGRSRPARTLSIRVAADLDIRFLESAYEHRASELVLVRDALQRHAGFIFLDDVIEVRDVYTSCHVYCPESVNGLVIADGILTKQCQCTIISAVLADELE